MPDHTRSDTITESSHAESVERVRDLISDIKVTMLTTTGTDGRLHSRPMYTQETEFDGDLWFTTSLSSALVAEIRTTPTVLLNYANVDSQRFVVISGEAVLVHDQAKKDELWNPSLRMWFKGGPTDPDLVLVKIEAHRADFWDSPSAPVRWFQFLAGVATGKRPSGDERGAVAL
jgi:general stress protein 26